MNAQTNTSGSSINLTNGTYLVGFTSVEGFIAPEIIEIAISADALSTQVVYTTEEEEIYEGFTSYPHGQQITGSDGGSGWTSAWSDFSGWSGVSGLAVAHQESIGYMNGSVFVAGSKNSALIQPHANTSSAYLSRSISTLLGCDIYLSGLISLSNVGSHFGVGVAENYKESGLHANGSQIGLVMNDAYSASSESYTSDEIIFFIIKYSWGETGYNQMSLWVNPTNAIAVTETPVTVMSNGEISEIHDIVMGFYKCDETLQARVDELRIGTSWQSVVPSGSVPEIVAETTSNVLDGDPGSFEVTLSSPPAHDVTLDFTQNDIRLGLSISETEIHFTPDNWNIPQEISVTGSSESGISMGETVITVANEYLNTQAVTVTEIDTPISTRAMMSGSSDTLLSFKTLAGMNYQVWVSTNLSASTEWKASSNCYEMVDDNWVGPVTTLEGSKNGELFVRIPADDDVLFLQVTEIDR